MTTLVPNAFFKGGAAVRPFRDRALLGAISIAPDRALGDALESVVLTGQTKAPAVNSHAAEVIDVDVRPCARLANLTWLGVTRCAGVIGLEALEAATKLEGLAIHWATDLVDLQSLRCPTLRRLRVDWCTRLRSLGDGDGFPHLRELGVTVRAALPPLSRFRDLEVVDLMNADDPAVGESLRGLPGLRSVTLRSCNGVRDLAVFERAERMEN